MMSPYPYDRDEGTETRSAHIYDFSANWQNDVRLMWGWANGVCRPQAHHGGPVSLCVLYTNTVTDI